MDGFVIDLQVFCANFCIIPIGKGGKYENENQNKYAAISLLFNFQAQSQIQKKPRISDDGHTRDPILKVVVKDIGPQSPLNK